jgi:hypothetical protein
VSAVDIERRLGLAYLGWAVLAITLAWLSQGATLENITRGLVIGFLLAQLAARRVLVRAFPTWPPMRRFVLLGVLLAAVVEGLHMISAPVFPALRIDAGMPVSAMLRNFAIDLLLTLPAYVVIFAALWAFVSRWDYGLWPYVLIMGLAQALGDGGLVYFIDAPQMLAFLPYPMSNYHAMNLLPLLTVREQLPAGRPADWRRLLAIPAIIVVYFLCGALIRLAGGAMGLQPG